MDRLTGMLVVVLMCGGAAAVLVAGVAAAPPAQARALSAAQTTALAQACKDKKPGITVTVGGRQMTCPAPSGRFFNTCEECNGVCPGPCFLTSASNCQCMLFHQ